MAAALRPLCGGWARSGSPVLTPAPSCWACSVDKWVGVFTASIIATQRCIRSRAGATMLLPKKRCGAARADPDPVILSRGGLRTAPARGRLRRCGVTHVGWAMDDFAGFWSGGILGGDAPRRPYVAMLGMGMDGCAGGVAPLRPYDMVGRGFRCFACASMTAPFLSPARGGIRRGLPPQQLMMAGPSFGLGQTAAPRKRGGHSLPVYGLSITHKCLGGWRACYASIARLPQRSRGGSQTAPARAGLKRCAGTEAGGLGGFAVFWLGGILDASLRSA